MTEHEHDMTDGQLLNSIGWRLAVALGRAAPGDQAVEADISELVDEACERLQRPADTTPAGRRRPEPPASGTERITGL